MWHGLNGIMCTKDPYETLGVNRSATDKEIKDAFKKLARKFHPDLHPGDKEAEAKFKDDGLFDHSHPTFEHVSLTSRDVL